MLEETAACTAAASAYVQHRRNNHAFLLLCPQLSRSEPFALCSGEARAPAAADTWGRAPSWWRWWRCWRSSARLEEVRGLGRRFTAPAKQVFFHGSAWCCTSTACPARPSLAGIWARRRLGAGPWPGMAPFAPWGGRRVGAGAARRPPARLNAVPSATHRPRPCPSWSLPACSFGPVLLR